MKTILFVDDDAEIISSTRRLLYTMHRDWQVTYASSAVEALGKLSGEGYDVVVSDIRMPGMSGIDLLEQVRQRYPRSVRIALSGHADREAALRASGLAHRYLAKPCPIEEVAAAIQQSLLMVKLSLAHLVLMKVLLLARQCAVQSHPVTRFMLAVLIMKAHSYCAS